MQDNAPPASETPHHPLVHESFGSGDFDYSGRWVENSHPVEGALSHPESEGPAAAVVAAAAPNLNHEVELLKLKVKAYAAFGSVLGLGVGIGIGTLGTMIWHNNGGNQSDNS